ncbi:hypothetical protein FBZ89_114134 [Nitrospirillum amazonense]|uniref:Uncharacterized protein n=1 Tax=Nitrospirillum amazonense TaxID=28077 RepID=A0A560F1N7_9PROT|nr:zinc ribbon domain-containing protein [Nitrospirillum amazonense]TWB15540.1 hypothetical protein FBZ89_114134 [Nitrospirillum amazonense]
MAFCSDCGKQLPSTAAAFCGHCGSQVARMALTTVEPPPNAAYRMAAPGGAIAATVNPPPTKGGFVQTFGLDIRVAILTVIVDTLVFSGTIVSLGTLYFFEIGAGFVLGFVTYKIQKNWYGDDHHAALIKALVIGLVTAIPAPISGLFTVPGGALGLIHMLRRK